MKRIDFILILMFLFGILFTASFADADNFTWNPTDGVDYYQLAIVDKSADESATIADGFIFRVPDEIANNVVDGIIKIEIGEILNEGNPVLKNDTYYEAYIRGVNNCGNASNWSAPVTYGCFAPSVIELNVEKSPVQVIINVN